MNITWTMLLTGTFPEGGHALDRSGTSGDVGFSHRRTREEGTRGSGGATPVAGKSDPAAKLHPTTLFCLTATTVRQTHMYLV
jgi:hypothetical protein